MERLTVLSAERFALQPDRDEVFGWLQCNAQAACHAAFAADWEPAVRLLRENMAPCAAIAREGGDSLTVFLTLGAAVERRIDLLFSRGEYVLGSLLNTLCDEMLFQMDAQAAEMLRALLAAEHLHMADRQEPVLDFSAAEQRRRFAPMQALFPAVRISEHGTISPAKSMMYGVTLSREACGVTSLHDCARCSQLNCPYRTAERREE